MGDVYTYVLAFSWTKASADYGDSTRIMMGLCWDKYWA